MTQALKLWSYGLTAMLALVLGAQQANGDEKAFERAYNVQQKGYANYFKAMLAGKGKDPGSEAALRKQYIEPARQEGRKAFREAGEKTIKDLMPTAIKPHRDHFARLREAEKTRKKPEKPGATTDAQRDPAAKATKQFEKKPGGEAKPVEALDGKNLQDVIDF